MDSLSSTSVPSLNTSARSARFGLVAAVVLLLACVSLIVSSSFETQPVVKHSPAVAKPLAAQ